MDTSLVYVIIKIYDGWEGGEYSGTFVCFDEAQALAEIKSYLNEDAENSVEVFGINTSNNTVLEMEYRDNYQTYVDIINGQEMEIWEDHPSLELKEE